ncbi:MAG: Sir2 family NAD-dependent protein deacetylase [Acidimicrobiia bacterium]|nr:Sir2 family NAD-dependent protein deacetylase [Acidimicrobiia bacterium]MDH3462107.1 Sir2 family NAD-dependent protein deacetylase [Acidimicrobiia bacterium]
MTDSGLAAAVDTLSPARQILVFSGAGLSTESGIPDFRGPQGLWTRVDPDEFHIDRYLSDREVRIKSWAMHARGDRWGTRVPQPNRGHDAVARLGALGRLAGVVTQNIDGLQQAAGVETQLIAELHGNFGNSRCVGCGRNWPTELLLKRVAEGDPDPHCEHCGAVIKTDVVMFGEELPGSEIEKALTFLARADAVLVVGSTVSVWPASDIVLRAAFRPIPVVIINQGETEADHLAAVKIEGAIGDHLPRLVAALSGVN